MPHSTENQPTDLTELVCDLVSAYVANNSVPVSELPRLIQGIHTALTALTSGADQAAPEAEPEKPTAAQVRKSVMPDGLISFLDGKTYQTLKRHLSTYGLDPQSYRARFGLPADYPMVAPNYAKRRSDLAKNIGLGRVVDRSDAA